MPVLSIHFGSSEISFLYFNSPKDFKQYTYSYVYSSELFSNYISESAFYEQLIARALIEMGVDQSVTAKDTSKTNAKKLKYIFTGFPAIPSLNLPNDFSLTLDKIVASTQEYFCVYVDNFTIMTPAIYFSAFPEHAYTFTSFINKEASNEVTTYFANLSIFPQITTDYSLSRLENDNLIRYLSVSASSSSPLLPNALNGKVINHKDHKLVKDQDSRPILFCGERFTQPSKFDPLTYLLMIDLVKQKGIFDLRVDNDNLFAVAALLSQYSELYKPFYLDRTYTSLGTLINAEGTLECLIEESTGPSQFIEVKNNELFLVPLEASSTVKIKIKNNLLGNIEKSIKGGKLGLIIDTRSKDTNNINFEKYTESNQRIWEAHIKEVLMAKE